MRRLRSLRRSLVRTFAPGSFASRIASLLVFMGTVVFCLWLVEHRSNQTNYRLCMQQQANRQVLRDMVSREIIFPVPEGADPALRELIERAIADAKVRQKENLKLIGDPIVCKMPNL